MGKISVQEAAPTDRTVTYTCIGKCSTEDDAIMEIAADYDIDEESKGFARLEADVYLEWAIVRRYQRTMGIYDLAYLVWGS